MKARKQIVLHLFHNFNNFTFFETANKRLVIIGDKWKIILKWIDLFTKLWIPTKYIQKISQSVLALWSAYEIVIRGSN